VAILAIVYAFSMADRTMIAMLIGPLKRDLGLGDFHAGLLLGPAFAVSYVALSFPMGALVDRMPRRVLVAGGLLVWTASTLASGFASTIGALFLLRALVGAGEATITPSAHSLLSDLFPPERRASAFSVYQSGSAIGAALGVFVAGVVLDRFAHGSPEIAVFGIVLRDWQLVFIVLGLPGLMLAFLPQFLPEPRQASRRRAPPAGPGFGAFFAANRRILILMFLIFGCSVAVTYAQVAWTAEYLSRTFGWPGVRIGATLGLIDLVFPVVGHLASGVLADRLAARGRLDAPLRLYAVMVVIALPFGLAKYLGGSPLVFLVSACAFSMLFAPSLALSAAAIQQFTPDAFRGRVSATFLAFISLAGLTIGPAVTGALTEFGFRSDEKLGVALALVSVTGAALIVLLLWLALPALRKAVTGRLAETAGETLAAAGPPDAIAAPVALRPNAAP
jgi:MFS family permease